MDLSNRSITLAVVKKKKSRQEVPSFPHMRSAARVSGSGPSSDTPGQRSWTERETALLPLSALSVTLRGEPDGRHPLPPAPSPLLPQDECWCSQRPGQLRAETHHRDPPPAVRRRGAALCPGQHRGGQGKRLQQTLGEFNTHLLQPQCM